MSELLYMTYTLDDSGTALEVTPWDIALTGPPCCYRHAPLDIA